MTKYYRMTIEHLIPRDVLGMSKREAEEVILYGLESLSSKWGITISSTKVDEE